MDDESLFLSYVRHIFKTWVGFQAAIDAGMGGPYAREKEEWLGVQVENYFKLYDDVRSEDIEEYLENMLENEFDTTFEDGSLQEVSAKFCNAYGLSLSNPNADIFQEIKEQKKPNRFGSISISEEISTLNSVTQDIEQMTLNDEEEGWTMVSNKHRKHK